MMIRTIAMTPTVLTFWPNTTAAHFHNISTLYYRGISILCGREDAAFMELMEAVSTRASDEKIEALCGVVYDHLMGDPWPEDRIEDQIEECRQESEGHPEESRWYKELFRYIHDSAGRSLPAFTWQLLFGKYFTKAETGIRQSLIDKYWK